MPFLARAVSAAVLTLCATTAAVAEPTWITVGEAAHTLLRQVAPEAKTLSSRAVAVDKPERRGSRTLVRGSETVHAVELDDASLQALSEAVHEQLHRCGGFVRHASLAESLAVLHRLEGNANRATTDLAAPAPSYAIDNVPQVNALLPQLQASNILSGIQTLSDFQNRRYNSTHGVAASNWLFNQWTQLAASRRDSANIKVTQVTHTGFAQKSVSFEITGSDTGGEVIVVGAHLDSTSSGNAETQRAPGADDDASGVATLTEIIRVLTTNRYQPRRTLRIVAYAGEEGGLLGSRQVVAAYGNSKLRQSVVGVMQLDMTAYQGDPTDLWIYTDYTNAAQNQFLAELASAYLPQLSVGYDACGYGCSDHASWHNAGYVASFPFEASDAHYNMRIHTVNDTIATFGGQADHALKFAKLALAYAVELASDGRP